MQQRKEVPSVVSEVNVFTVQVEAYGDNGHTNGEHGHRKTSKAASVGVGWGIRPPRRGPNNGRLGINDTFSALLVTTEALQGPRHRRYPLRKPLAWPVEKNRPRPNLPEPPRTERSEVIDYGSESACDTGLLAGWILIFILGTNAEQVTGRGPVGREGGPGQGDTDHIWMDTGAAGGSWMRLWGIGCGFAERWNCGAASLLSL
ncbi:hypothetical protein B0T16DRAFT_395283 [Cercophora newfieldiana]|uniref:Uncharacterized protein n=1 Tax=Cercophora newfieldiana TaxID=92897 RepID=A0AA40CI06_9PEZI|nr:hypothetical protein B0T16DRAFT_395283 [Cercophora newfieldiana]